MHPYIESKDPAPYLLDRYGWALFLDGQKEQARAYGQRTVDGLAAWLQERPNAPTSVLDRLDQFKARLAFYK